MPKSCSTICPRPESCDAPRALMSVAPNLCCDSEHLKLLFFFFFFSVTSTFYLEDSRRERESETESEHALTRERERDREKALCLLFYMFFSSTWAYPMQIGLSQECCLFCLKFSLWSLDLPLTFLVFSHHHFGLLFPILPT